MGGGDFLKMSLGVLETTPEPTSPVLKSPKLCSSSFKDSGVKKQLLIAISEGMPETYENIQNLLKLTQSNSIHFVLFCDMKVANIICGIQSHASKHPCCWCDADSSKLGLCGSLRIFGGIKKAHQEFIAHGNDVKKAKQFGNVIHSPLLNFPDESLILDAIPPMELHLLLGVVNHLYKNLSNIWPECKNWPEALNIPLQPFHGGHFQGNHCQKLLKNVDILQEKAEAAAAFAEFPFIDTFRKFEKVVVACFGMQLDKNYQEHIENFRSSYHDLPATITPKVHAVFFHVSQFISQNHKGLGHYSEQATEALHSNFKPHWQRFKRQTTHPEFA